MGWVALASAATFTWLGMVLAISFLEAPLKFQAPGITVPLGVGIGRLVFRALNISEGVLAVVLLVSVLLRPDPAIGLVVGLWVVLAAGALLLRPRMDRRVLAGRTASAMPRHSLHRWYILLELIKVVLLVLLGIRLLGVLAG
jgi:hypothetical protein